MHAPHSHVLLNLLNKLGEKNKMPSLPSVIPLSFCNEFNKFNNSRAQLPNLIWRSENIKHTKVCIMVNKYVYFRKNKI